jgi:hypothetical protein
MRRLTLDTRSVATILAALRWYQHQLTHGKEPTGEEAIAIHNIAGDGTLSPLSPEDIDELCEHINLEL